MARSSPGALRVRTVCHIEGPSHYLSKIKWSDNGSAVYRGTAENSTKL